MCTKLALFTRNYLVLLPCRYSVIMTKPYDVTSQKTSLFLTQALNKMLGVGWLLRRAGHSLGSPLWDLWLWDGMSLPVGTRAVYSGGVKWKSGQRLLWGTLIFYVRWLATWISPWPFSDFHVHKRGEKYVLFGNFNFGFVTLSFLFLTLVYSARFHVSKLLCMYTYMLLSKNNLVLLHNTLVSLIQTSPFI
jgi:hypothetical protein